MNFSMAGIDIESPLYRQKYFITSRVVDLDKRYTIRRIEEDKRIGVFGLLDGFSTRVEAQRWLLGNQKRYC